MCVSATQQNAQPVSVSYYTSYIGQAFTGTFLTAVEDTMTKVCVRMCLQMDACL
jgi:hypothetical protein